MFALCIHPTHLPNPRPPPPPPSPVNPRPHPLMVSVCDHLLYKIHIASRCRGKRAHGTHMVLQDGLFMIAFDKPWAAVEWAVTLQLAMLKYAFRSTDMPDLLALCTATCPLLVACWWCMAVGNILSMLVCRRHCCMFVLVLCLLHAGVPQAALCYC